MGGAGLDAAGGCASIGGGGGWWVGGGAEEEALAFGPLLLCSAGGTLTARLHAACHAIPAAAANTHLCSTLKRGLRLQVNDKNFMKQFDLLVSYRRDSDVPFLYAPFDIRTSDEAVMPRYEARNASLIYVAYNCKASNGRNDIVQELVEKHGVPVSAPGRCLHNMPEPQTRHAHATGASRSGQKIGWMKGHRVCVAMENSLHYDYVTEKLWDAFAAGGLEGSR